MRLATLEKGGIIIAFCRVRWKPGGAWFTLVPTVKDQIDQARWIAVMAATAIALYLCWLMLRPFIGVLEWAIVLVIVFYPVHRRLKTRIKGRSLSALTSCFLVVLVVVLPLTVLTMAVAEEIAKV